MTLDTRAQDKQASKQTKEEPSCLAVRAQRREDEPRENRGSSRKENTAARFSKRSGQRRRWCERERWFLPVSWLKFNPGTWREFKTTAVTGWDFEVTNSHRHLPPPLCREQDKGIFCFLFSSQTFSLVDGKSTLTQFSFMFNIFIFQSAPFLSTSLTGANTLSCIKALDSEEVWPEGRGSLEEKEKVGGLVCVTLPIRQERRWRAARCWNCKQEVELSTRQPGQEVLSVRHAIYHFQ